MVLDNRVERMVDNFRRNPYRVEKIVGNCRYGRIGSEKLQAILEMVLHRILNEKKVIMLQKIS